MQDAYIQIYLQLPSIGWHVIIFLHHCSTALLFPGCSMKAKNFGALSGHLTFYSNLQPFSFEIWKKLPILFFFSFFGRKSSSYDNFLFYHTYRVYYIICLIYKLIISLIYCLGIKYVLKDG